jgi:hypothetical protein
LTQPSFEQFDLLAHGAVGDTQRFGGSSDAAAVGDNSERSQ